MRITRITTDNSSPDRVRRKILLDTDDYKRSFKELFTKIAEHELDLLTGRA